MNTFGDRLSYLRNKRGLSQEELAKIFKIGKSTLGMYETNKREPAHEMTSKFADFFEVSVDWLTTGKEFSGVHQVLTHEEIGLKKLVEKYNVDLDRPGTEEKLEQIIKLVFSDDHAKRGI